MNHKFPRSILLFAVVLLVLSFSTVQGFSDALLVQPASMPAYVAATSCTPYYVIRPGDTLSAIAVRCGVSTIALARANGLLLTTIIFPGQRLVMPGTANSASTTGVTSGFQAPVGCPARYTIRAGDTLGAIARRCGVSVAQLKLWNNLRSDLILIGQVLSTGSTTLRATPVPLAVSPAGRAAGAGSAATPAPEWAPVVAPTPTPYIESPVSTR